MLNEREIPVWVAETPDETEYVLAVRQPDCEFEQYIEMTRDEYVSLKACLARMRGYVPEKPLD